MLGIAISSNGSGIIHKQQEDHEVCIAEREKQ